MIDRDDLIGVVLQGLVPLAIGLGSVLLLNTPLRLFEGHIPTPIFPLILIFFWTIYDPDFLPTFATFLIGMLQDMLLGGPIGVWASIYLIVQYAILSQRDYFLRRDQHVVWLGFALSAAMAGLLLWLSMSLFSGAWLPPLPVVWQMLVTVAFYPVLAVIFSKVHKRVIVE